MKTERFVVINGINTYFEWGLILTEKNIPFPEPKIYTVDIDGLNGAIDLTEALTGETCYKNRTIDLAFWTDSGSRADRDRLRQRITYALHGKTVKMIEPDDPDHYFAGRIQLGEWSNKIPYATLKMSALCDPWRYAVNESVRQITGSGLVVINNQGIKTVCPEIAVSTAAVLQLNGDTYALNPGKHRNSKFKLSQGINIVNVETSGTVTFTYQEATL